MLSCCPKYFDEIWTPFHLLLLCMVSVECCLSLSCSGCFSQIFEWNGGLGIKYNMFLRGRTRGRFTNIVVGTALGIGSGTYLFHDIFGPNAEHLVAWNQKLKEEAQRREQEGNRTSTQGKDMKN